MNKVLERLWVGDAADGRNMQLLSDNGITAVFNATQESDNWTQEFKAKTSYLKLDQADGAPIPLEKLDAFKAFMKQVYGAEQKTVLIHCGAGISRASTFTILTLMLFHNMTWAEGEKVIRDVRPIINPHPLLKESVMSWWTYNQGTWLD